MQINDKLKLKLCEKYNISLDEFNEEDFVLDEIKIDHSKFFVLFSEYNYSKSILLKICKRISNSFIGEPGANDSGQFFYFPPSKRDIVLRTCKKYSINDYLICS